MRTYLGSIATVAAALSVQCANAQKLEVQYGKVPAWVVAPPTPTSTPTPEGASIRINFVDTQIRADQNGVETYLHFNVTPLRPEALSVGNLVTSWNPSAGIATVNAVTIHRDGATLDVLKQAKFEVVRQESSGELAILKGDATASLRVPGLQVGDTLDFEVTIMQRDPTIGDHVFGSSAMPPGGTLGTSRIRFVWPTASTIAWRVSDDVPKPTVQAVGNYSQLIYELRDPKSLVLPQGAPPRYALKRMFEYSDFRSWADVAGRLMPLYDKASTLSDRSPIKAEAANIAAAHPDAAGRTLAALRLVQDRIRYVYVGMNGGNFQPAAADDTWTRRFGDCKGKTALLLALLRELGVPAEAVVVNSNGGDGTDARLPSPIWFDHVVVRARPDGVPYWLDGTRTDDHSLALLPEPVFRWALPLRAAATLEAVPVHAVRLPLYVEMIDIDATAGFAAKAKVAQKMVVRGNDALQFKTALATMTPDDARSMLLRGTDGSWFTADTASWRSVEAGSALEITLSGLGKLDWTGSSKNGHALDIPGAGFIPPDEFTRPKDQDQSAPWAVNYPAYRCWATTIRLPKPEHGRVWNYMAKPVSNVIGGVARWRVAELRGNVMRTIMSSRSVTREISAAEAAAANKALPTFDKWISNVFEFSVSDEAGHPKLGAKPIFDDSTDWASADAPCGNPALDK